jgi:hypothetical protein
VKTLRKGDFITLLSALILVLPLFMFAQEQDSSTAPDHQQHQGRGMMPSTDDRLEHLSQVLNLSEDQKAKIRPMLDDESNKMQTVWQDDSTPRDQKRAKMQQIHQDTTEQMKTVLNAAQQKKLADMQAQMKQHMGGKHGQSDNNQQ